MAAWHEEYGEPPRVIDWSQGLARAHGYPDLAARFEGGHWPTSGLVAERFGSWNAALAALGVRHTSRGISRWIARHSPTAAGEETTRWTQQEIIEALRDHHRSHGQWPTSLEWTAMDPSGQRPTAQTVKVIFGRFSDAILAAGGQPLRPGETRLGVERRARIRELAAANREITAGAIARELQCHRNVASRHLRLMRQAGELPPV